MKACAIPLFALSLLSVAAGWCSGRVGASPLGSAAASDSSGAPLTLSWRSGESGALSVGPALLGQGGTITVFASGTPPYHGTIYGNCARLAQPATTSSFALTVSSYGLLCVLVVDDASQQSRAIAIGGSPPRAFLQAKPSIPTETGTVRVEQGSSFGVMVNELLVGQPYNTPYTAQAHGACATVTPKTLSTAGLFSITGSAAGRCVVVFSDSAGQATALNLVVLTLR